MKFEELIYEIKLKNNLFTINKKGGYSIRKNYIISHNKFNYKTEKDLLDEFNVKSNIELIKFNLNNFSNKISKSNINMKFLMNAFYINKKINYNNIKKNYSIINYYLNIFIHNQIYSIDSQNDFDVFFDFDKIINNIFKIKYFYNKLINFKNINLTKKKYNLIISKNASGFIIHEIVGHLSEIGPENITWWNKNTKIFNKSFTVIDDPTLNNMVGSYPFDDEGIKSSKKYLVKDGIINEHLASYYYTNANSSNGNARCENYKTMPKPRMSNTYLAPINTTNKNILCNIGDYLFLYNIKQAGIDYKKEQLYVLAEGILYTEYGQLYKTGELLITENLITFIQNIDCVNGDLHFASSCWCFKNSNVPIPVKYGAPTIRINNINITQLNKHSNLNY